MRKPDKSASDATRWQAQLAHDIAFAGERLVQFGELEMMFALHTRDNQLMLLRANTLRAQRRQLADLVRLIAIAYDVVAISTLTEAWMRGVPRRIGESEADFHRRATAIAPSEAEDRIEVVIVVLAYRDDDDERHVIGATSEIIRDAEGKATGLRDNSPSDEESIEGMFAEVLPGRAPEQLRHMAREVLEDMGLRIELVEGTMQ